jgi:hypothetical protein
MSSRGSDTYTHYSGGFLDREVVIEHELQNLALSLGELAECVTQAVAPRLVLNLRVGRRKGIRGENSRFALPPSRFPL